MPRKTPPLHRLTKGWLRRLLRRLRKNEPLAAPVRVVWRRGVRHRDEYVLALAVYDQKPGCKPKRFRIVLDSRMTASDAYEAVIHEWAHLLDRSTRWKRPRECHDQRWGQCYARTFLADRGPTR